MLEASTVAQLMRDGRGSMPEVTMVLRSRKQGGRSLTWLAATDTNSGAIRICGASG